MWFPSIDVGTRTEPPPFDLADPGTPPIAGWLSQSPGAPSELRPELVNDIVGEIIRLQATGNIGAAERDSLRQIFRNDDMVDKAALPLVELISTADTVSQVGSYKRVGQWIFLSARVEWANTNAALDSEPLRFHLPYQAAQPAVGRLSITQSNFRLDNPAGVQAYEPVIIAPPTSFAAMWRANYLGAAAVPVSIGDSVADGGSRVALFNISYRTSWIRNPLWPYIEWYSVTHTPIAPGPTVLEFRYDGAMNGDVVDLFKSPDFVNPVDSQVISAPNIPSGRGSFVIPSAGGWLPRIRGKFFGRNQFQVSAS